jgi:hypothetical protein
MRVKSLVSTVSLAVAALFLTAASTAANADTVYNSAAAFAAATSGLTTIGFPSPGYGSYSYVPTGSNFGGVSFVYDDSVSTLNLNDAAYYQVNFGSPANPTNYLILFGNQGSDSVTIGFPISTAFSIELGGTFGPNVGVEVDLSDGFSSAYTLSTFATSGGGPDFLGFTSTSPFSSATLSVNDTLDDLTIDQVQYGATAATPEPSSLIMLGTGLLGLGQMIRRKMSA